MVSPKKTLHPLEGPYCCPEWERARQKKTDCEGWQELIWRDEIARDDKPHIGNIGLGTNFPPLRYCPWCGHCWEKESY